MQHLADHGAELIGRLGVHVGDDGVLLVGRVAIVEEIRVPAGGPLDGGAHHALGLVLDRLVDEGHLLGGERRAFLLRQGHPFEHRGGASQRREVRGGARARAGRQTEVGDQGGAAVAEVGERVPQRRDGLDVGVGELADRDTGVRLLGVEQVVVA